MSLTRKMLTAMGIEADKIDQIIESHTETVDGLKNQAKELKEQADRIPELEKKIQELEDAKPSEDYEAKYEQEHEAFEQYKAQVAQEKADAEKSRLYEAIIRDAGITKEKIVRTILKDADLAEIAVKDGAIQGADEIKASIAEEWGDFIPKTSTQGASVPTPPEGGEPSTGASPEVLKRLQERHDRLYGKADKEQPNELH